VIPSAAVFAAAISDAEGFALTSMPISPSELFALRQARSAPVVEEVVHRPSGDPVDEGVS
jgi:carbon-monoxide dehydrogenase large subunit